MKHPIWVAFGTVVGVLGLIVTYLQFTQSSPSTGADVKLAAVSFGVPATMDAEEFPVYDTADRIATTIDGTTPLDVTLTNNGGTPAHFTRIDAEVEFFESVSCLQQGGEMRRSAFYSIQLPTDANGENSTQLEISVPIDFEVKANGTDRMAITVGPETLATNGAAIVMGVRLKLVTVDEQTVDVGLVALTTDYSSQVNPNFVNASVSQCIEGGIASIDRLLAMEPVSSAEVARFREGLVSVL